MSTFSTVFGNTVSNVTGSLTSLPWGILSADVVATLELLAAWEDASGVSQLQVSGTGTESVVHSTTQHAPDHEDVYRSFDVNETVWRDGRVVENIAKDFLNLSNWTGINATVEVENGRIKITTTAAGGYATLSLDYLRTDYANPANYVGSYGIESVNTLNIYWAVGNSNNNHLLLTGPLNGRYSDAFTATGGGGSYVAYFGSAIFSPLPLGAVVYVSDPMFEMSTGRTDVTKPSEYVAYDDGQVVFPTANGNTVASNVVTEATGSVLSPSPRIIADGGGTNKKPYSNTYTLWAQTGSSVSANDAVGITGVPNTASTLTDDDSTQEKVYNIISITPTDTVTLRHWIKKDTDVTRFPAFNFQFLGGVNENIHLNTMTGEYAEQVGSQVDQVEVIDGGDWWILLIEGSDPSTATQFVMSVIPAAGTVIGVIDNTATGSCIAGQSELHTGKTIDEVKNLGPIFTSGSAVSTTEIDYEWDDANLVDAGGAVYFKSKTDGIQRLLGDVIVSGLVGDGSELLTNGGFTTDLTGWTQSNCTAVWTDGYARVTRGASTGEFYQVFVATPVVIGTTYIISVKARYVSGSGGAVIGIENNSNILVESSDNIPMDGEWHTIRVRHTAESISGLKVELRMYSPDGVYDVDDFSVQVADEDTIALFDRDSQVSLSATSGITHEIGAAWYGSQMALCVDGVWSSDVTYGGDISDGTFDFIRDRLYPAQISELRTWSGNDYQALKDAVDAEMT